jgi:transposase
MKIATVGLDLAKNVFQLHAVDAEGQVVVRRRLRRSKVVRFLARLPPCLVGMEACAGAHHWARTIAGLGHEVRLMPPAYVKAYVRRQKNDLADAAAICEAVTRPSMRFVPIKGEQQQAMLLIHRARDLLVRQRTGLINALRAHLAEFGVILPKGGHNGRRLPAMLLAGETFGMAAPVVAVLLAMARRCQALEVEIAQLERELRERALADAAVRRLVKIPGVGPITATALAATIADPRASARHASSRPGSAWPRARTPRVGMSGSAASPRWATPTCVVSWSWGRRPCSGTPPSSRTPSARGSPGCCARSRARSPRWRWQTRPPASSGRSWPETRPIGPPPEGVAAGPSDVRG